MRKGRLQKTRNYPKNSIDWERFSSGDGINIHVSAYLDAHDMKTFCSIVEMNAIDTTRDIMAFETDFSTIEEAFAWAESHVDYKNNLVRKGVKND